ncbi:adenylate/guanylate cyclase domain-containing protein [Limnoglobus roseus]|uniref:Adenylate/guanylate cyclase domain-containing protein n=1 Tax=Limnoglobus roseus TaxID=2598579 RepID=A0A5C1AC52_9BACT|nr:adenylate/guanylate cyclase domain-containing protein [Limnoglobus roseus]QEL15382.1 adenylate/guanylate cyclase domain-containing protein [Limnoglobus roseus]
MPRLEATLLRPAGGSLPMWVHELEVDKEISLAQIAGMDDGRGGIVTLGVAEKDVPEIDYKNVSGHGYHALLKWDGQVLHVTRRTKPKRTTNGFLTAKGQSAPDVLELRPGDSFRIARFLFSLHPEEDSAGSLPYQTTAVKAAEVVKPQPIRPPTKFVPFDPDPSGPDLNVSIAPDQLQGFANNWAKSSTAQMAALRGDGPKKEQLELAVGEAEVLRTPLVDSDNVITGLLDIVDRFDPTRSTDALDEMFRQAVRRAVANSEAAADVVVIPAKGDPRPRGKERMPWFSRTFVRDAARKVGQNGGVLAGFWKADAGQSGVHPKFGGSPSLEGASGKGTSRQTGFAVPGWAVCAPVQVRGSDGEQLALYVSAPFPEPGRVVDLASDPGVAQAQKVVLLFAKLYAALDRMSRISVRFQEAVGFLPRPVQRLLNQPNFDQQLAPRTLDVTVLFCDLRGSCGFAAQGQDDLQAQWSGIFQNALEQMSRAINDNGGVIGGFIGDAVMGFWGWPDPLSSEVQIRKAARAALSIRENFARLRSHRHTPLSSLRIGIGLTHGPALVGKLGNFDMKKIDVFGPTVNRSARIEALTKRFGVEIIVDAAVAGGLGDPRVVDGRLRRLVSVAPAGMDEPFSIFELLPYDLDDTFGMKEAAFTAYEEALHEFEAGDAWERAGAILDRHRDRDGPSQYLYGVMADRDAAPEDWLRDERGKCYIKLADK